MPTLIVREAARGPPGDLAKGLINVVFHRFLLFLREGFMSEESKLAAAIDRLTAEFRQAREKTEAREEELKVAVLGMVGAAAAR